MSTIRVSGDSSGYYDLTVPSAAGTNSIDLSKLPVKDASNNLALNGNLTIPNQPAFSSHRTSSLSISSTNATVVFNAVAHNQGSHYDNSTGIFTAPVSGLYFLSAALGVQNGADSRYFVIYLQTGDTNYQDLLLTRRGAAINTTGTSYAGVNVSGVVSLNANDGVRVKAEIENSSNCVVSDKSCYFTGYLIG